MHIFVIDLHRYLQQEKTATVSLSNFRKRRILKPKQQVMFTTYSQFSCFVLWCRCDSSPLQQSRERPISWGGRTCLPISLPKIFVTRQQSGPSHYSPALVTPHWPFTQTPLHNYGFVLPISTKVKCIYEQLGH